MVSLSLSTPMLHFGTVLRGFSSVGAGEACFGLVKKGIVVALVTRTGAGKDVFGRRLELRGVVRRELRRSTRANSQGVCLTLTVVIRINRSRVRARILEREQCRVQMRRNV